MHHYRAFPLSLFLDWECDINIPSFPTNSSRACLNLDSTKPLIESEKERYSSFFSLHNAGGVLESDLLEPVARRKSFEALFLQCQTKRIQCSSSSNGTDCWTVSCQFVANIMSRGSQRSLVTSRGGDKSTNSNNHGGGASNTKCIVTVGIILPLLAAIIGE